MASWEVEEVLYTWASGMVKSRSKQNHRVKDLASPPGSVSLQLAWQFTSGDCMRIIKSVTHQQITIPLVVFLLIIDSSSVRC